MSFISTTLRAFVLWVAARMCPRALRAAEMEADLRLDDDGHSIMRAFRAFVASPQGCACMGVVPYDGIRLIAVAMSHDASLLLLSHPGSERAFHFLFVSVCEVPDEARRVARLLPRWTINHILHENVLLLARMTDALSADDARIHAAHLLFNRHDHDSKVALLVQHGDRAAFHAEQQYSLVAGLLHTEPTSACR